MKSFSEDYFDILYESYGNEPRIIPYINEIKEKDSIALIAGYSPTVSDCETFCESTFDRNPIHKQHETYDQAIVPGYMNCSIASLLAKECMRRNNLDILDYKYKYTDMKMDMAVVSGKDFINEVRLKDIKNKNQTSIDIKMKGYFGKDISSIEQIFYKENMLDIDLCIKDMDIGDVLHEKIIKDCDPLRFGYTIGSNSSESNLYLMSLSSNIIFDAIDNSKLPRADDSLVALYSGNIEMFQDISSSINFSKGIKYQLFINDPQKFGKPTKKGDTIEVIISASNNKDDLLYLSRSNIGFYKKKMLDIIFKSAKLKKT